MWQPDGAGLRARIGILTALTLIISLGACETVKEHLTDADKEVQRLIGTDVAASPEPEVGLRKEDEIKIADEAGALYQKALGHSERGETEAALGALRQAAHLGHREAAFELGETNRQGLGVDIDLALAARYYGEAAVAGHSRAQYLLAEAFAEGHGVPEDISWAVRWYGKAAYQGHAKAQFAYGVLMATGRGVQKNYSRAFGWLSLAEQQGITRAKSVREAVETQITAAQREASESWVQRFAQKIGAPLTDPPTVMYIQHQLTLLDYSPGPEDGILGSRTWTAVSAFKRDHGLPQGAEITVRFLERLLLASRSSHS